MNQRLNEKTFGEKILFKPSKLVYWMKHKAKVILSIAVIGLLYQFATLAVMFANDVTTAHDIALWNGYFPWWTIFFMFTFWTNFICFLTYFIYCFFGKSKVLQKNNFFVFIPCVYISLVILVVACALMPAAFTKNNGVDFSSGASSLTLADLIMPHFPSPILFMFFSLIIFSLNRAGNKVLLKFKLLKSFAFALIFITFYLIMDIMLSYIPIGAYYINEAGEKIYYAGFSPYVWFTNVNPNLVIVSNQKVVGHGSGINLLWYAFALALLLIIHGCYYAICKFAWNPKTLEKPKFYPFNLNYDF